MISTAEEFIKLRESEIEAEYLRAAHEPAPLEVWLEIISKYPAMKSWVAHNKSVPLEVLELLAKDSDEEVRFSVATKRKLSPELFDLLAKDPSESVRERIAYNPKAPLHILELLAKDEAPPWQRWLQRRCVREPAPNNSFKADKSPLCGALRP